ncbi:YdcF family protein [Streptomyces sp. VRA16 Mangrove soil]|uniref:YdcF family protein n=1 Tax=Streptomyces sp. VRA16 Mangrove soil TaxID=2817434 RepID=UPI001A9E3386|nr:YdcF family protein [Streptomyces sp. VRA16 Mangrove soil]MBO1330713.1 YdcF family protein [Streptomyces sp. VRA16 Mangrove soil]
MLLYVPSVLCLVGFCAGVVRERRRLSNAVFLGLTIVFAAVAALLQLGSLKPDLSGDVAIGLLVVAAVAVVVLAGFLLANGITMVRKEGRSPANLVSLGVGLALIVLLALLVAALVLHTRALAVAAGTAVVLAGHVAFLFVCFLFYSALYQRLAFWRRGDFVVVLGSGLIGGSTVPPLLAGRLDRAHEEHTRLSRRGRRPVLIVSGGQGPDEELPESHAMASYLLERGFPADLIEREDRSTTTEENLTFSQDLMRTQQPAARCVIVTSDYHAFRAAITARRLGVRGHVVGAPTASYFWPSAVIREFIALVVHYRRLNAALLLVILLGGLFMWWWGWPPTNHI